MVKSLLLGFSYQHVYSFYELLSLLDENSLYERGRVEDGEARHVDDVTLYPRSGAAAPAPGEDEAEGADDVTIHPRPGAAAPARFIQVKWHAALDSAYSFESLCAPGRGAATSLLQKFYKSWKALGASGDDMELWLVSTWPADVQLGRHIRRARLSDAFFNAGSKSEPGKQRAAWAAHLGCDEEELREFARCLRFRLGLSDDVLRCLFHDRMRAYGLRTDALAMEDIESLVRRWVTQGPRDIQAEALRRGITERGLWATREEEPRACLWIHGWARSEHEHPASLELDWTTHFDRDARRIATNEDWQATLMPALAEARAHCERARASFVDIRGLLPLSAALAAGAALPAVAGYRLRCAQVTLGRTALWRSDALPSSLSWQVEPLCEDAAGRDSLVVLSISGDASADFERWLAPEPTRFGRVLLARPASEASDSALQNDADAVALANEARKLLKQERQRAGARCIHLILYAPAGFALFLGQRLNALGDIATYEQSQDGGYQPSVVLHTT